MLVGHLSSSISSISTEDLRVLRVYVLLSLRYRQRIYGCCGCMYFYLFDIDRGFTGGAGVEDGR
jgi:hypothetical protein